MSIVTPFPRIASAHAVLCGAYGAVSRLARQRGVCRQWLYREADWVNRTLDGSDTRAELQALRSRLRRLEHNNAELQRRIEHAVVLDHPKQAEFACVGQAHGVSLPNLHALLQTLIPGRAAGVATLGRWTRAAGRRAGALLAVLDPLARARVRQAVADEIHVPQPVLMVVEPDSLCWLSGRRLERLDGAARAEEFGQLPHLEQVTRDAGSCPGKGMADHNAARQEQGLPPVADQLDHFHALREGGRGVGRLERAARRAEVALAAAEAELARKRRAARRDQPVTGILNRVRARRTQAERTLAAWVEQDGLLRRPQTLTFLDEVQGKLAALALPAEVVQAAVQQEGLRRQRGLWQGTTSRAAALRGVLLVCGVVLAKAGEVGEQAVHQVRGVLRSCWRASSLVECVNSVVRMHQGRHRKVSQGLLDLKRLYWNTHVFRTGRRKKQSPYQLLGVPWPEGVS